MNRETKSVLEDSALVPPLRRWQIGRAQRRAAVLAGLSVAAAAVLFATVVLPGSSTRPNTSAAAVLAQAAVAAADKSLGPMLKPGQFLYVRTLESAIDSDGVTYKGGALDSWTYRTSYTKQEWIAPDGSGRVVVSDGSVAFLTPKDQSAWAASGQAMPAFDATNTVYPPGSLVFPDSANLPTDPSALEQAIVQRYENGQPQEIATFTLAGTLLQESASPALRVALFRMIEQLPGIMALGPMTDRLGRTGVGVGFTFDGVREELIFDPSTAAVLEEERVVVSASPVDISPVSPAGLARGTVVGYTVYVKTGIANSNSTLPSQAAKNGQGRTNLLPWSKRSPSQPATNRFLEADTSTASVRILCDRVQLLRNASGCSVHPVGYIYTLTLR